MSSNVVEQTDVASAREAPLTNSGNRIPCPVTALVSLTAFALLALSIDRFLPNRHILPEDRFATWMDSLPAWKRPYPFFLGLMLVFSLLLGFTQFVWQRLRPWARYYAPLLAGGLGVLCIWDLSTAKLAWMPQPFFPGPDEVFGALIEDTIYQSIKILDDNGGLSAAWEALWDERRSILLVSTVYSLKLLLAGFMTGAVVGFVWGVLIGWFRLARYWGMPVLKLVGPMPATALVPLAMLLSTDSFVCAMMLIAYAVWFPMTMLTASGIANVRLSYLDVARTLGAGKGYLIFRVAIPSALPNVFLGLFVGLTASFLTLAAAETLGVKAGLAWYLGWRKSNAEYANTFASIMIMSVFFSSLMTLLFKVRERVLKWQQGTIRW